MGELGEKLNRLNALNGLKKGTYRRAKTERSACARVGSVTISASLASAATPLI